MKQGGAYLELFQWFKPKTQTQKKTFSYYLMWPAMLSHLSVMWWGLLEPIPVVSEQDTRTHLLGMYALQRTGNLSVTETKVATNSTECRPSRKQTTHIIAKRWLLHWTANLNPMAPKWLILKLKSCADANLNEIYNFKLYIFAFARCESD